MNHERLGGEVEYIIQDAVDYFRTAERLPHNIIIFPKSISEFSEGEFTDICNAFRRIEFKYESRGVEHNTKEIHLLISLRTDGNREVDPDELEDKQRSDLLIEAMRQNGFDLSNAEAAEVRFANDAGENGRISESDPDFRYPDDIWAFMSELNQNEISRFPINSTRFICNRIMTFKRR